MPGGERGQGSIQAARGWMSEPVTNAGLNIPIMSHCPRERVAMLLFHDLDAGASPAAQLIRM
ncbi:MAG TPA: hypothetical protein VKF40_14915 [Burkholderiales bacterium]|nr:hypothetical protein [Burkholderiales bacterium]